MSKSRNSSQRPAEAHWTFLSNHAHVLVCLAGGPDLTMRQIADRVGITERAVQGIIADLETAGVITRRRDGRRNVYDIHGRAPLRHPIEAHRCVADLIGAILGPTGTARQRAGVS